jgi:hypothetical protein
MAPEEQRRHQEQKARKAAKRQGLEMDIAPVILMKAEVHHKIRFPLFD